MSINFEEEFKEACVKGDTQRVIQILQPKKKFLLFNTKRHDPEIVLKILIEFD